MDKFYFNHKPQSNIVADGKEVKVTDDGDVTINGKSIESLEEHKQVLAIIIKALCTFER